VTTSEPTVRDNPAAHRFELLLDGRVAGFAEYLRQPDGLAVTHTVVQPEHEGHGFGSVLAKAVLVAARAAGDPVLPFCPFLRGYLQRHPEYQDLVPEDRRAQFDLA
jgi:predicted GNAT family acetyltransferase